MRYQFTAKGNPEGGEADDSLLDVLQLSLPAGGCSFGCRCPVCSCK